VLGDRPVTAAVRVPLGDEAPLPGVPNLALRRERAPNLRGAELLGYGTNWKAALAALPTAALVVVLDVELDADERAMLDRTPGTLLWFGTVPIDDWRRAAAILPVTTMAEENGTYVNRDLRVQRFQQARSQPGMARPAWWVAGEVLLGRGPDAGAPATGAEAFALLAEAWPVFGSVSYAELGFTGRVLDGLPAEAAT
jgi:hypothetical protein